MKVFLINVGVNASHTPLRSPYFGDGRFRFVPIPETREIQEADGPLVRYVDLFGGAEFIPCRHRMTVVHNDPEFENNTYGDFPMRSGRPAALRHARRGDVLLFLARLVPWDGASFNDGRAGFFLVGQLQVESMFTDISDASISSLPKDIRGNAHVRRALANADLFDDSWVFRGGRRSGLFDRAVPFTLEFARKTMRDSKGEPWVALPGRTELQTIGSYTRSIRMIADQQTVRALWEAIGECTGRAPWPVGPA